MKDKILITNVEQAIIDLETTTTKEIIEKLIENYEKD